jgi:hypothetical protein
MEHNLSRLRFTKDYVGVIRARECLSARLRNNVKHHPKAEFLYYENQSDGLWLGFSGEHIDPLAEWFLSAHRVVSCSSTIAAVLATKAELPKGRLDALLIDRAHLTAGVLENVIQSRYTIYLAHSDEFLVFVPEATDLGVIVKERIAGLHRCHTVPKATLNEDEVKRETEKKREPYDPIFKQIQEVTDTIGASAKQAASDLVHDWRMILRTNPPDDIQKFEDEIEYTIDRIRNLSLNPRHDILSVIDDLAMSLRAKRRASFGLYTNLRDFEWPPSSPTMNYERAATSLMLRAVRRYAHEVAKRLDVDEYNFMPVVGQDYDVHPGLFSVRYKKHLTYTTYQTVLVEFPAEIRLRLGAIPVIAHQIARMRERDLERIANLLAEKEDSPDLRCLFRGNHGHHATDESRERDEYYAREKGKQLAADLLATAATGPQYVFAIARFAIGTLGDFGTEVLEHRHRLTLSARISACLQYLGELSPKFESPYFTRIPHCLPPAVLDIVRRVVRTDGIDNRELQTVTETLRDGRIVADASPIAILAALWNAVVRRSGYLHEIAALISIAAPE